MNYALLVCVNKYKIPGNNLRGCLNDVKNMRVLLGHNDFSVMHVRSLTDEQATKKRIMDSLEQMVSNMKEGDHGVFHFSGHGSQVIDTNNDESDSLDEILCPYDFDWTGTYITDDGLREILGNLHPGATLDALFDACHSGTGLREAGDLIARFIPYTGPMPRIEYNPSYMLRGLDQPNVALWAGCRSDQTSADAFIDNIYQGAMTWAFTRAMQDWDNQCSRDDLIQGIHLKLSGKFDQEPQLETSDDMRLRRVFA